MERIRVLVAEDDRGYSENLGKALACCSKNLEVEIREIIRESLPEIAAGEWDVILTTGAHYCELEGLTGAKVYVLSAEEIPGGKGAEKGGRPALYRYMGAEEMGRQIRDIYAAGTGRRFVASVEKQPQICAFYSAAAGTGKTAVALGVAAALAEEGDEQVLYVSLEELTAGVYSLDCRAAWVETDGGRRDTDGGPGRGDGGRTDADEAPRSTGGGAGDFLYYLFSGRERAPVLPAESYTLRHQSGVHTFVQKAGRNPFRALSPGELEEALEQIVAWNHFDYIIADLAADLWEGTCFLLECCDWRFLVEDGSLLCRERTRALQRHFEKKYGREFWESFIPVRNFAETEAGSGPEAGFSVMRDPGSFLQAGGRIEINRNGAFGRGVEEIAAEIRGAL